MFAFSGRRSFGEVLDSQRGFGAGFDVLRWALALLIFYGHCKWIAGAPVVQSMLEAAQTLAEQTLAEQTLAERGWSGWRRPFQVALVPMFFALSGFLVTASALRVLEVRVFLTLRALRIFPALAVEVGLSALVLGPILTVLVLGDYFTHASFLRYFGNIIGLVVFDLPGVFTGNKVTNIVNANLWTLPAEFYCYLTTALLMASSQMFDRAAFTRIFAIVTVLAVVASLTLGFGQSATTASTPLLVYYFFTGCLFYHWRHAIPRDLRLLGLAAAGSYALLYLPAAIFLAPLFVVYVTVYFGLFHHDRLTGLRRLDYSYGIYLYGFPITQAVIAFAPSLQGHGNQLALIAGGLTLSFAAMSWHLIEAPMLAMKQRFLAKRPAGPSPRISAASVGTSV